MQIYYVLAFLASIVYLYLTFAAPVNPASARLGLNEAQIFLLKFTIAIPYIATWFFAMYGLSTLNKYLQSMKGKSDIFLPLLQSFLTGLFWIIMGTMLVALTGGLRSYFIGNPDVIPIFTIITNYLYVFPSLVGFIFVYNGVRQFGASKEMSEHRHGDNLLATFAVIVVSVFYLYLIYTNPNRQISGDPFITATYYLPDSLILLTLILPILATWWIGFSAAFTLSDLIPHSARRELHKGTTRILYGIWAIIFTSIFIQALVSLGGTRLYSIGIGVLLFLIYIFVILQGLGYFYLALGANSLRRLK